MSLVAGSVMRSSWPARWRVGCRRGLSRSVHVPRACASTISRYGFCANWFPYRRFRFDPFTPALLRELSAADVIHVHQPHTLMGTTAILHAKASGRALFSSHLGGYGLGLHRLTAVDRFFDGHLHISEFSRQHSGHAALSNSRTILGGTDVATFRPPTEPTERREVVFVGRILPHKGLNYLVEAIDPDVSLAIVGRHWRHAGTFNQLLMKLAEGKRIRFVEGRPFQKGVWAPLRRGIRHCRHAAKCPLHRATQCSHDRLRPAVRRP